jgi:hypothetical protein
MPRIIYVIFGRPKDGDEWRHEGPMEFKGISGSGCPKQSKGVGPLVLG